MEALFNRSTYMHVRATARRRWLFWMQTLVSRKKIGEYLQQVRSSSLKAQIADDHVPEHLATLANEIEALDAKKLQMRQLAQIAGLEDWYLVTYAYLSSSVHSTARDLEDYFEVDADGDVAGLVNEPTDHGLGLFITLAVEIQSLALEGIANVFDIRLDPAGEAHFKALQELNVLDISG